MNESGNSQSLVSAPDQPVEAKKSGSKFKATRKLFVQWLACPGPLRFPKTAREFAIENAVSESTLSTWRRRPDVEEEVRKIVLGDAAIELADVLDALKRVAKAGNVEAIRLYLEFVHRWVRGATAPILVQNQIEVSFGDEQRGFWNDPKYGAGNKMPVLQAKAEDA